MSPPTASLWLPLAHVVVLLSCQNITSSGNLPGTAPVRRNATTQSGTFTDLSCQDEEIHVISVWISIQNTDCIKRNEKLRIKVSRCNGSKCDCKDLLVNVRQKILCKGPNDYSDTVIVEFECIEGPDATSKATTRSTVCGPTGATDDSGFLGGNGVVYIGAACAVMLLLAVAVTSLTVYLKRRRRHRAASDQTTGTPHELRSHADHVVNAAENEYSETGPSKNSTQQVTMATAHPSETYTEVRFRRESDDPSDLVLRENAIYGQAEEYPPQHDGKPQHDGGGFSRQANNDENEAFLPRIAREGPEVPPPDLVDGMDAETLKTPADDELFMDENDMYGSS